MSQFYWGLKDDVKDLLLSLPDLQTLNEAISQAVKCDNRLFQRRQDQRSRHQTTRHGTTISASSLNSHLEAEDMQIDAARVKSLTPEEKKTTYGGRIMFVLRRRRPQGWKLSQEAEPARCQN